MPRPAMQMPERRYKNLLRNHRSVKIENARQVGAQRCRLSLNPALGLLARQAGNQPDHRLR